MKISEAEMILASIAESEITDDSAMQAIRDVAAWIDATNAEDLGFVLGMQTIESLDKNAQEACVQALKGFLQIVLPTLVQFCDMIPPANGNENQ